MKNMQKGFTLIELMIVVAIIAILAAIAIPAYQDYLVRSQVSEGMSLADGAKTAIAEFYSNKGHYPTANVSAGLAPAGSIKGTYVSQVNAAGGKITASYGNTASNDKIKTKVLVFSPFDQGGSLSWSCKSTVGTTVDDKYLPAACRP